MKLRQSFATPVISAELIILVSICFNISAFLLLISCGAQECSVHELATSLYCKIVYVPTGVCGSFELNLLASLLICSQHGSFLHCFSLFVIRFSWDIESYSGIEGLGCSVEDRHFILGQIDLSFVDNESLLFQRGGFSYVEFQAELQCFYPWVAT